MEQNLFAIGFLLIILGGIMEGSFSLPLKFNPKWKWENTWGAGSLLALLLVPWPLAFLTVPNLLDVYAGSSQTSLLLALLFGAGWGAGGIFFGKGLAALGLSLGLSLIMGLIAIGGSIIPLLMQRPEQLSQPSGIVLMAGIAVMIIGLITCAKAGQLKELGLKTTEMSGDVGLIKKIPFKAGLFFCIAAGLLSALVNFGLIFGNKIASVAVAKGASLSSANNAIWALVFTANYLVNIFYCLYLARHNHTFQNFLKAGTKNYWIWALFMGLLWPGGIVIYGIGATHIGTFGAYLGFPVMLICSILVGNVLGVFTGEWRGVGSKSKRVMVIGVILLVFAIAVLGYSSRLVS